jgi:DNA-binding response OmpR family regulator
MIHRVLIVDDDPEIMEWLSTDLKLSGFYTETASNGMEGLQKSQAGNYDLIILDVMMPKMDGFEVCGNLRKSAKTKDTPVILLTANGTLEDMVTGFGAGADDFLINPFDIQELLVWMRALLRRTGYIHPVREEVLESGDIKLYPDSLEVHIQNKLVKLTPTEFEILYCLMQHINQAVKLTTLLNEVWGYDSDEDVRMVRVHIGGLRNKIEPNPKYPKYLHTVTNVGYRLVPWGEE